MKKLMYGLALAAGLASGAFAEGKNHDYHLLARNFDPRLNVSNYENLEVMTVASAAPAEKSGWTGGVSISPDGENIEARVAYRYTGGGFKEFLWGVSRPLHLYNHDEKTGDLEILPFYLDPLEAGGFLSPLNPNAWRANAPLTWGALTADLGIALAAYSLSQDGGSDSPSVVYRTDSEGNVIYTTNPETGEKEPVVQTGGGTGTGDAGSGGTGPSGGSGDDTGDTGGSSGPGGTGGTDPNAGGGDPNGGGPPPPVVKSIFNEMTGYLC